MLYDNERLHEYFSKNKKAMIAVILDADLKFFNFSNIVSGEKESLISESEQFRVRLHQKNYCLNYELREAKNYTKIEKILIGFFDEMFDKAESIIQDQEEVGKEIENKVSFEKRKEGVECFFDIFFTRTIKKYVILDDYTLREELVDFIIKNYNKEYELIKELEKIYLSGLLVKMLSEKELKKVVLLNKGDLSQEMLDIFFEIIDEYKIKENFLKLINF